jgi:WD40 repeat protein
MTPRRTGIVLGLLVAFALTACAAPAGLHPNVLIEHTQHSGGSALGADAASQRVVSGGWEGTIQVWRLTDGASLGGWAAHTDTVHGAVFLTPETVLTASYDGTLAVWDLRGKKLAGRAAGSPVTAFDAAADRQTFVTGHADGRLRWWSARDLRLLRESRAHDGVAVIAVALAPDGATTASGDEGRRVALVAPDGSHRWLDRPPTDALTLAFARNRDALYGGGWFRLFRWDTGTGALQVLPTDHHGQINRIAFTPDGRELATISRQTDSAVLLLDPANGATRGVLGKHDLCGGVVTLSPDGRYVVSTSDDATVRIWDRRSPQRDAPGVVIRRPEAASPADPLRP